MKTNTYLFFNGDCEAAFKFYAKVLDGKIVAMMPHRGSPAEAHTAPEWLDKILHARLVFGDNVLMASDAPPNRQQTHGGYAISVNVDTPEEADGIYNALSESGNISMPIGETFFAKRFGMFDDRFGVSWIIVCEKSM